MLKTSRCTTSSPKTRSVSAKDIASSRLSPTNEDIFRAINEL